MHARNLLQHATGPRGRIYVEVEASVNRPEQQTTFPTNTFQFTYAPTLSNAGTYPKRLLLVQNMFAQYVWYAKAIGYFSFLGLVTHHHIVFLVNFWVLLWCSLVADSAGRTGVMKVVNQSCVNNTVDAVSKRNLMC